MSSRAEHLTWCKQRALEYVDAGDLPTALTSLISDLAKHPDTAEVARTVAELGTMQLMTGHLGTATEMRDWINGVT